MTGGRTEGVPAQGGCGRGNFSAYADASRLRVSGLRPQRESAPHRARGPGDRLRPLLPGAQDLWGNRAVIQGGKDKSQPLLTHNAHAHATAHARGDPGDSSTTRRREKEARPHCPPRLSGRSPLRALRAGLSFLRQGHLRISRAETRTKNTACDRQWEAFQSNEMKLPETACYGRINNRPWDRAGVGSNPSSSTYLTSNGYLATQSPHPLACERRVPPPQCSGKLLALSPARSQPLPGPLPQVLVGGKVNK